MRASITHAMAAPAPTGGVPANTAELEELCARIRDVATGWPTPLAGEGPGRAIEFDRAATRVLADLDIVPGDAGSIDVWSFLACVALPDVACWRYPSRSEERLIGKPRNVFRRLFWRAYVFRDECGQADPLDPILSLGEDEIVAIEERPTLGSSPILARAIVRAFLAQLEAGSALPRMFLMRELAKRLVRLTPYLPLDALSIETLDRIVGAVARATARNEPEHEAVVGLVLANAGDADEVGAEVANLDGAPSANARGRLARFGRDLSRMSQTEIADRIGIAQPMVSHMEIERAPMDSNQLASLLGAARWL